MGFKQHFVPALFVCLSIPLAAAGPATAVESLMEAGHWKRAGEAVETRLRTDPQDARAWSQLAKIRSSFGDLEGSVAAAERAVALDPNQADYRGQLAESCALTADKSSVVRGLLYVRRMKKEIDAALSLNARHVDTMLVQMVFSFNAPALAGGDKTLANRIADKILAISPVWGALAHARLLQDQGQDAVTEDWLQRAVRADPGFYRSRVSLARFYCCTAVNKRLDLAEKAAKEALELDPNAAAAYSILTRVYASQFRWAELEATLARAEKAVPDDLAPYLFAAQALVDAGQDYRRAERYIARYLSQPAEGREPTHAEAHWTLAKLLEREGRKDDAIRELTAALQMQAGFEPAKADLKRLLHS